MPKTAAPKWRFRTRFRKGAFGWRGSRLAAERIAEALREIKQAAKADPIAGAQGAIGLITRLSPALEAVDSSSGMLGSAVNGAISELVPIVATAPVADAERRKWLQRLWTAFNDDAIPYIESLGDYWGELCATQEIAAEWATALEPQLREHFGRSHHGYAGYFRGTFACFSVMFSTRRFDELLQLIDSCPYQHWLYRQLGVQRPGRAGAPRGSPALR